MTTTIAPANSLNAPLVTQQGVGTSPGYGAIDLRRMVDGNFQEGVGGSTDFMVVERGVGPNLSVDITMPAGGWAKVQGDTFTGQGLYTVPTHASTINEAIATADSSNPRVDIVILEVLDNAHDASGNNLARVRVLSGTPSVGATLDNRTGAPALPGSALLLADVLVPASDTTVSNSQIRDRRKWARGARRAMSRASSDITVSSSSYAELDATNLKCRLECSGVPLLVQFLGVGQGGTSSNIGVGVNVDGTLTPTATNGAMLSGASANDNISFMLPITPAAGSHLFAAVAKRIGANNGTIFNTNDPISFIVEEILRPDIANNSVTTG